MKTRVLLVDDHTMFREALRIMLNNEPNIEVVGELGDGSEVDAMVAELSPDVVVMDISMPKVNGIDATLGLLARFPDVKVVALSAFMSLPVMLLWDWLMPTLFGLTTITWFQAWGLMFLFSLLFKSHTTTTK